MAAVDDRRMLGGDAEGRPGGGQPAVDLVHTGPGTLAGRYLRMFWHPVLVARDLHPGRARPIKIMSEDFTLYRGESGEVHALAFRCAHRGTQLSTGWVEGDNLRCFYHGWTYDGNGQCVEQPAEPEPFCNRIRIKCYPVHEYLGLIFVFMGEGEAPPMTRFLEAEDFDGIVSSYGGGEPLPCNYFNRIDQSAGDNLHTFFAHRESRVPELLEAMPTLSAFETPWGTTTKNRRSNSVEGQTHFTMPNINMFGSASRNPDIAWFSTISWRLPVDDEHYTTFSLQMTKVKGGEEVKQRMIDRRLANLGGGRFVPGTELTVNQLGDAIVAGERHWLEFPDRSSFVNVQDYVALVGQGVYAPREVDHLGASDVGVALVRRIWERELRALAEGRPLTQWERPRLEAHFIGIGDA